MKCPSCDCHDTRVIDSRETADDSAIRRRRQCVACGKRFTTYERWERPELRVVKRDGRVEDFDRDKLEVGMLKACEKRPIGREAIGAILDGIEEELRGRDAGDVPTTEIGGMVLERLKALDQVAYIRFASVYKAFEDPAHFEKELKQLSLDGQRGPQAERTVGVRGQKAPGRGLGAQSPPKKRDARE